MAQLQTLQSNIHRLRAYRTAVRLGAAGCAVGAVVLGGLFAVFLLDVWLEMGVIERVIAELAWVGAVGYGVWKFLIPALKVHEDDATLAMVVENNHAISSDLIAALQFNDRGRAQHGSNTLRSAVVDYVDELGRSLDVMRGFDKKRIQRRGFLFAALLLVWLIVAVAGPAYLPVFATRLGLVYAQYPTQTRITEVVSPGNVAAYGQALRFAVQLDGKLPETARAEIDTLEGNESDTLTLRPSDTRPGLFEAQLDNAYSAMHYRIFAGDDRTRLRTLKLTPLPKVTLDFDTTLPEYAKGKFEITGSAQRLRVLEGTRVIPRVRSDKPLQSARLVVGDQAYPMQRVSQAGEENANGHGEGNGAVFTLPANNSPLAPIKKTTQFQILVTDNQGLSPQQPMTGMIRVRQDQPPTVNINAASKLVLPQATPRIQVQAKDEFGIKRVALHWKRLEANAENAGNLGSAGNLESAGNSPMAEAGASDDSIDDSGEAKEKPEPTRVVAEFGDGGGEGAEPPRSFDRAVKLALSPMDLEKGNRLRVVVEAVDDRGSLDGKAKRSRPITFEVTDREGLLESMREQDKKLHRKLESIIDTQLQIGESK